MLLQGAHFITSWILSKAKVARKFCECYQHSFLHSFSSCFRYIQTQPIIFQEKLDNLKLFRKANFCKIQSHSKTKIIGAYVFSKLKSERVIITPPFLKATLRLFPPSPPIFWFAMEPANIKWRDELTFDLLEIIREQ